MEATRHSCAPSSPPCLLSRSVDSSSSRSGGGFAHRALVQARRDRQSLACSGRCLASAQWLKNMHSPRRMFEGTFLIDCWTLSDVVCPDRTLVMMVWLSVLLTHLEPQLHHCPLCCYCCVSRIDPCDPTQTIGGTSTTSNSGTWPESSDSRPLAKSAA